jgi:hypothetical protein
MRLGEKESPPDFGGLGLRCGGISLIDPPSPVASADDASDSEASLLPRALLVAIRLQALPALVLVHLQPTLLLEITHECSWSACGARHPL